MNKTDYNPKVFISYAQESISFGNKVLEFADRLRGEGIDANIDQYEESPAEGWPRWMENQIRESDFVLIICTNEYLKRMQGVNECGVGRGVKWESNIIYQYLYTSDSLNDKFIPVVLSQKDIEFIPTPLRSSTIYNISYKRQYDDLYWRLRKISTKGKPQLGKLRPLPEKERKSVYVTSMIDIDTWNKAKWRGAGYCMDISCTQPPYLLLLFNKRKEAAKIFNDWIKIVGKEDENEEIRIALIEGDIEGELPGYTIHIGTNLDQAIKRCEERGFNLEDTLIFNTSRLIRANPKDNFIQYNRFKSQYSYFKEYYLLPAVIDEKDNTIHMLEEYRILKKDIHYRNVADITENDEDAAVITPNKPW